MFDRPPRRRNPSGYRLYVQDPAEVIRRVTAGGRYPPGSVTYRQVMTVVDTALRTHPDYRALTHLATAVERETGDQP